MGGLCYTPHMLDETTNEWIKQAKARGLGQAIGTLLDVLEPIGPLGAQLLWLVQPVTGIFGWHHAVGQLAESLEEPGGIEPIRRALTEEDTQSRSE